MQVDAAVDQYALQLAEAVDRYERTPTATEHERLRPRIAECFGEAAAEFFDQEGRLPLIPSGGGTRGLPWPMKLGAVQTYRVVVTAARIAVTVVAVVVLLSIMDDRWGAALLGIGIGSALWLGIPLLAHLRPPTDLAERERLVQAFVDIRLRSRRDSEEALARRAQTG